MHYYLRIYMTMTLLLMVLKYVLERDYFVFLLVLCLLTCMPPSEYSFNLIPFVEKDTEFVESNYALTYHFDDILFL